MARKRTLSTLDTSIAYEAVGLDLAKEDAAIAAFGPDHEGPYLIDRMPYDPKSRSKRSRYSSENDVLIEKSVKYTDFFLLSIVYV